MKENDFLRWIAAQLPGRADVPINVGDDMAAVRRPEARSEPGRGSIGDMALLKIDQCLDQVHFDLRVHSAQAAGRKAVNRCLSDCAAMACRPAAILLSVALPQTTDDAFAQALFTGCRDAAAAFDCPIVGGDTGVWDQRLAITVAAMAWAHSRPVSRSGAKAGDAICVTGQLGGSILGRHMTFTPRIEDAQRLVALADIRAMMDLSDGLAMDLPRLCHMSGVGAQVELARVPVHADAVRLANAGEGTGTTTAAMHALADGEDYELLFTLAQPEWTKLQGSWPAAPGGCQITRIGTVTGGGLVLVDVAGMAGKWPNGGWEHETARTHG